MKLQYFNGGLGNQIFQYIFYRYLQIHVEALGTGEEIWLDNMKFFKVHEHNGYELESVFGLKPNLISNYFDADVWEYMVETAKSGGGDLCQQMKDMGSGIIMVAETSNFAFDGKVYHVAPNQYHPELPELKGDIYFFGYWINKEWFRKIREAIMAELIFPVLADPENLGHLRVIEREKCVSVHIRRGDFCTLGFQLPEQFYREAMDSMGRVLPEATYLVFSDDIPWCKDHFRELGLNKAKDRIVFVTGNEGDKSYIDVDLMSRCQGMILANSSFSYFAALYNGREDKVVINPSQFREI